ncbi:GtrA family protein [uncultured Thiohalocapsa sp.]|uniref:GtrA family protein n=1 Tax=uncultured Thiohalocapsa sp. TaxID=768990 RepID=UPI0025EB5B8B|nr:GtrA family protein [uncultured Thiohalocapsa sp.]
MRKIAPFYLNRQFARFLVFSGLAAATNLLVGVLLYERAGLDHGWEYGVSVSVAFVAGMAVSFVLNRWLTFVPSGRSVFREMQTFLVVSLGGLTLTVTLSYVFRGTAVAGLITTQWVATHIPASVTMDMLSHFLAVGLVTFYSFACHKLFSFGPGLRSVLARVTADATARHRERKGQDFGCSAEQAPRSPSRYQDCR